MSHINSKKLHTWKGEGPHPTLRQTPFHQLHTVPEWYSLPSAERIHQLSNSNNEAHDIYTSELPLGVDRDVEMRGKANKLDPNFNKDTATTTYEAAQFINKNIRQPTIDVGKVKITPGACTCHLDSKHIKPVRRHYFSANKGFDSDKSATFASEAHLQGEHTRGTRPQVANLALSATIAIEAHLQGEHTYGTRPQVANLALSAIKHKGTAPSGQVRKYPTDTFLSPSSLSPSGSYVTIDTQPSVPASQHFSPANYEVKAFKDNVMNEEFKSTQETARKYPTSTSSLPSLLSPSGSYVVSDIYHWRPPDPTLPSLNNFNLVD